MSNNNMRRSCALLVDNTKVTSSLKVKFGKIFKIPTFYQFQAVSGAVIHQKGLMVTHTVLGRVSFQHPFLGNLGKC